MTNIPSTPHSRKAILLASLVMLSLSVMSCSLPGVLASASATPQPSPTALAPLDTATAPAPTETMSPTASPTPSSTPTSAPANIAFATGTTAAVEQGTIEPNQVMEYTLSADKNQPMILLLSSPNNDVYLGVSEPDGNLLLDPAKKWTNWQWLLPKTEAYTIQVHGGATSETYSLTAKVAQRINFAAGATSATLNGTTTKGYVFSYTLTCAANQEMSVSLNVPASTAYLDVFGLATGSLLSSGAKSNTWTGILPATQDYIIEVIPVNGKVVNYTLTVSVN
jgi:hypothetical protein